MIIDDENPYGIDPDEIELIVKEMIDDKKRREKIKPLYDEKFPKEYPDDLMNIFEKNEHLKNHHRKLNISRSCYKHFYQKLKENHPENYERKEIEANKILESLGHFIVSILLDILDSKTYSLNEAKNILYSYIDVYNEFLLEREPLNYIKKPILKFKNF